MLISTNLKINQYTMPTRARRGYLNMLTTGSKCLGSKCVGSKCPWGQSVLGSKCLQGQSVSLDAWGQSVTGSKCPQGQSVSGSKCPWGQSVLGSKCLWGQSVSGVKVSLGSKWVWAIYHTRAFVGCPWLVATPLIPKFAVKNDYLGSLGGHPKTILTKEGR